MWMIYINIVLNRIYKREKYKTLLIVGPIDSGKTSLLLRLLYDKFMLTVTSQCSNECMITLDNRRYRVIDTPGSLRLIHEMNKYLNITNGIICMVDSSDKKSLKLAANLLIEIILNPIILNKCPPIIIVGNKIDLLISRDIEQIKDIIELEIERIIEDKKNESYLIKSQPNVLKFLNNINTNNFKLEQLNINIQFTNSSVKTGNIINITNFIKNIS